MPVAITRKVSPSIARCELTHLDRTGIDPSRAASQHETYCRTLAEVGCRVVALPAEPELPDAVFVEDGAVVVEEIAVLTRPGALSRRPEIPALRVELKRYRPIAEIAAPGTLDGGDVLQSGRTVWVGRSGRSNAAGIRQLGEILNRFGYVVIPVGVQGCLHLKTAVTRIGPETLLLNPAMVEPDVFPGFRCLEVDRSEPMAANALLVGETVIYPEAFPATRRKMEQAGFQVRTVPADELAKAEGGVTCCSIVLG